MHLPLPPQAFIIPFARFPSTPLRPPPPLCSSWPWLIPPLPRAQVASAIYPDDHWQYSTKLTSDNFDEEVAKAVDGEHTLMVRWIASSG